jgi:glycosyltransferase involved in cell wall biosynthesis
VFFGLFTPLQGTPTVGRALGLLADTGVEALMVGRGQDLDDARAAAAGGRVTWREWVPADELPELVAAYDVCLGVFGTGPKALRVVPNKVFQGAAAGCAIVTSDTPPQRRVLGDAAVLVPPGDPEALAAALRKLADDRDEMRRLSRAAADLARAAFTPAAVAGVLRDRLVPTVEAARP